MLSKKSSVVMMMLLIATAASLVGMSIIIFKPVNVETLAQRPLQQQSQQQQQQQPTANQSQQQQQPTPNAGQVLKQYIPPVAQQPQSPLSSSMQQQKVLQSSQPSEIIQQNRGIREINNQILADNQLLDRIFPLIIKRLDGATLLKKIDGKTLASKVLPYIQVTVPIQDVNGPAIHVKKGAFASTSFHNTGATCPAEYTSMGGGLSITQYGSTVSNAGIPFANSGDNGIASLVPRGQIVLATAKMNSAGDVMAWATCLGKPIVRLAQQPQ